MSRGRVWLWVTRDPARGVALLRGAEAREMAELFAEDPPGPVYSRTGRGWVVPLDVVGDLRAYAEMSHELLIVHDRKDGAA